MPRDLDPSLNRRRLRVELRKARYTSGLTKQQTADALDWSLSKIMRIEAGTVGVSVTDVRALMQQYEVTDPELVSELEEAARGSKGPSWWAPWGNLVSQPFAQYLGYEGAATSIRIYNPIVLPGLVQTEDYATALLSPTTEGTDVRRSVELRTARQERYLDSETGPRVEIVLDEAAVRRVIGGPRVMRRQLEHITTLSRRPQMGIRLLPFTVGAHFSTLSPFILLGFKDDDDLLYLEGPSGGLSNRDDLDLTVRYQECFADISDKAYDGDRMIEFLDTVKESLDND
ncbi:helix-turn-helix domain-containing protein [Streptomyces sp. NBC_00487]|uniref:helix-turn-helix domain-containing protein n=1 Tax=unclassified Streptomyces TaxID=2593676 RepID=UPI002DD827C1|nr:MULTISPECIES: helix-turn-helix transcriptional regulator [unclassified Streptomyces]WRY99461.1 helix-turn-helix domain-containing protein [Streptomyces sp. NBC_00481]